MIQPANLLRLALEALIGAFTKAEGKYGKGERRTDMIFTQAVRQDELSIAPLATKERSSKSQR
ncbi:MAG: hypothetical protein ACOH2R_28045 [Pseudomonas sp.]